MKERFEDPKPQDGVRANYWPLLDHSEDVPSHHENHHEHKAVGWADLFGDLVFISIIGELSHLAIVEYSSGDHHMRLYGAGYVAGDDDHNEDHSNANNPFNWSTEVRIEEDRSESECILPPSYMTNNPTLVPIIAGFDMLLHCPLGCNGLGKN